MQPLTEVISELWRKENMPTARQNNRPAMTTPPRTLPKTTASMAELSGDILSTGRPASTLISGKLNVALYGRNRIGKTTLACQGDGPIALLAIDPSPTGGARSITRDDVVVYQIAAERLNGDSLKGSEKLMAVVDAIRRRPVCPFKKVVVDGLTSWNDIILSEVLGESWENMPAILGWGKVSMDQYTERSERMMRYLKPIFAMPCNVWVLAQEKDHNPPKETDKRGKMRPTQSKLMREAHPAAQEGSFWSLAIGESAAVYVQNACDFIVQLYDDNEWVEQEQPPVVVNGETVKMPPLVIPTGNRVRRLRCNYHTNYAAGPRSPDYRNVPDYIEASTPEERYQAFLDMAAGKRTKFGKYSQ